MQYTSHEVSEVHIDLNREAILHTAKEAQVVIIKVQVFSPNGRPTTRSLRIPTSLLREPPPEDIDNDPRLQQRW
jgi:hypothetical protein